MSESKRESAPLQTQGDEMGKGAKQSGFYPKTLFNVVLLRPEIPNNTGNIGRTCVGMWSKLHLVGPLGFSIDDKQLKRAGLDYWDDLDFAYHKSIEDWKSSLTNRSRVFLFETTGTKNLYDAHFEVGDTLVFGRETKGIPASTLAEFEEQTYRIDFPGKIRSFNLANTVAMVMGEAGRQIRSDI